MKNNPIQTMLLEHEIICRVEEIIKKLDGTWEDNSGKYKETVLTLINFFREYADENHHRKEEEVLFPAICNHPEFILNEIIDELEQHHEDFREYTQVIEAALDDNEFERSYKELGNYLEDLLDHIAVENDELFVLAESLLEEEDLETIYFKFKDIDLEIGEDRITELEQSIENLTL